MLVCSECSAKFDTPTALTKHQLEWHAQNEIAHDSTPLDDILGLDFGTKISEDKAFHSNSHIGDENLDFGYAEIIVPTPDKLIDSHPCRTSTMCPNIALTQPRYTCDKWWKVHKTMTALRLHRRTCKAQNNFTNLDIDVVQHETVRSDVWVSRSVSDSDSDSLELTKQVSHDLDLVSFTTYGYKHK